MENIRKVRMLINPHPKLLRLDSKVYGFVMLLYSQQLFNQFFNAEENAEKQKVEILNI